MRSWMTKAVAVALMAPMLALPGSAAAQVALEAELNPGQEDAVAPGLLYLSNFALVPDSFAVDTEKSAPYLLVVDDAANIVTSRRLEGEGTSMGFDLKIQESGELTYNDGLTSRVLDEELQDAGVYYKTGPDAEGLYYFTDNHELKILDDGTAFLFGYRLRNVDLTHLGGHDDMTAMDMIIQRVEPVASPDEQPEVLWEWRTVDHMPIEDATEDVHIRIRDGVSDFVYYVHFNSLDVDLEAGTLLVSSRTQDQLVLIELETGEIRWRLGGIGARRNDFTWLDDSLTEQLGAPHPDLPDAWGFSHQHDARWTEDGNILLFDNGNLKGDASTWGDAFDGAEFVSRVVEYAIDEEEMTVRKVWAYEEGITSPQMGSVQRLPNGNTLVGWGRNWVTGRSPTLTEVRTDWDGDAYENTWVLRMDLPEEVTSYRAYRFDAAPAEVAPLDEGIARPTGCAGCASSATPPLPAGGLLALLALVRRRSRDGLGARSRRRGPAGGQARRWGRSRDPRSQPPSSAAAS